MMLHRHFEAEKSKNITKLEDVAHVDEVSEEQPVEAPKKRGRPKKTD